MRISKHFDDKEFSCHCGCGEKGIDSGLVRILEKVRTHFDTPVRVTSGRRCSTWNEAQGSTSTSQHLKGMAADIQITGINPDIVARYVDKIMPEGGLGRYHTFTHIDVRAKKARWDNR